MWDAQVAAFAEHLRVLRYDTRGHGQSLVINAPERTHVWCCAIQAAKIGNPEVWNPRIDTVLRDGQAAMLALRDALIARWFTAEFAAT